MSWNRRFTFIAIAALAVLVSVPAVAHAQRGGGRRVVARPIVIAPYMTPYYDPFFWDFYRWGYPGWHSPMFYNRAYIEESSARIQVTPPQTEVYVDGYLAGVVDDFDGFAQRLRVSPGEHVIQLFLDGHTTIAQTMLFQPGESYRIRHAMEPLPAGEASPVRPKPDPDAPASAQSRGYDAFGRGAAALRPSGRAGARRSRAAWRRGDSRQRGALAVVRRGSPGDSRHARRPSHRGAEGRLSAVHDNGSRPAR